MDTSNTIPFLQRVTEAVPGVDLRLILRDKNPDVMNRYLTNGSRSIPVLIILDAQFREVGRWGPRPADLQAWVLTNRPLLAKGEVDIGLTFISEIITEPGVEVVGPLPRDISTPTALVGYISAHTREPEAAQALLRYLSSAEAAAVYKQRGMEPGR